MLAPTFGFVLTAAIFSLRNRRLAWAITVVAFVAIGATAATIIRDAYWDDEDVPVIAAAISSHRGYEGTDEYAPIGLIRLDLPGNPDATERPAGISPNPASSFGQLGASNTLVPAVGIRLHVEGWSAERRAFTEESATPVTLALRLVDYPSWEIQVDGRRAGIMQLPATSQVLVPLAQGKHRVEVRFRSVWDRGVGDALSGFAVFALLGLLYREFPLRRESAPATVAGDG
jgi:hypothetical protein